SAPHTPIPTGVPTGSPPPRGLRGSTRVLNKSINPPSPSSGSALTLIIRDSWVEVLGGGNGASKLPPRIRRERTDKHQLGLAVMPVATIAFGEAARLPQQLPARRPIAGAVKARAVDEGFR